MSVDATAPLLRVASLHVSIGEQPILTDVSFTLRRGQTLGVVGESGSGKSMTALAVMGLLPGGAHRRGTIELAGRALDALDERSLQSLRGSEIGMVFQEPMTALNPLHRVGDQVAESVRLHRQLSRAEADVQARQALERVGLPAAMRAAQRYPHELSGGQRQRVVIAIAIACRPALLIADEPSTALDVTTQAGILELLRELQSEQGLALMFISHDLAVVASMADEIAVMREGRIVDSGRFETVFSTRGSEYSQRLLDASTWAAPATHARSVGEPLLQADALVCSYPSGPRSWLGRRARVRALDRVSVTVHRGESVGLVGESGCGKSTLSRALLGLMPLDEGRLHFDGRSLAQGHDRAVRRRLQAVFQDPYGSFDPRHRVERLVAEPLHLLDRQPSRTERRRRVSAMLERVGIGADALRRYPHEFSGGQRQRIAIARALIVEPALVVLDEAVSALDVSVRAQVLALLSELAADDGLAYLFISHDLSVVRNVTDRVLVMRDGRIVEHGATAAVFEAPRDPYTQALLAAVPVMPVAAPPHDGVASPA